MTMIQTIVAAVGFVLCLPFVAAWVILAMIRGRNQRDSEAVVSIDELARRARLGRLAQRGRLLGEHPMPVGRRRGDGSKGGVDVV